MFFFPPYERDTWADEEAWSMHVAEMRSLEDKTDHQSVASFQELTERAIDFVMGWKKTREEAITWMVDNGILSKACAIFFRPVEIDPESFKVRPGIMTRYGKKLLEEGKKYYGRIRIGPDGVDELDADGNFVRRLCGDEICKTSG